MIFKTIDREAGVWVCVFVCEFCLTNISHDHLSLNKRSRLNALLAALIKKGDLVKAVKFEAGMV